LWESLDNFGEIEVECANCKSVQTKFLRVRSLKGSPFKIELSQDDFGNHLEHNEPSPHQCCSANPQPIGACQMKVYQRWSESQHPRTIPWLPQIIWRNHDVVSQNSYDVGQTDTQTHLIALKTKAHVYINNWRILDTHWEKVRRHVAEWLKLGIILPTQSRFNSPPYLCHLKEEERYLSCTRFQGP